MTMPARRDGDVARGPARVSSRAVETDRARPPLPPAPDARARTAEAERTLREITGELARLRDPGAVLQQVVLAAGRLVRADGAIVSRYDPADGLLHWGVDDGVHALFDPDYVATLTLEVGVGLTGRAVAERQVLACGEDLVNAFPRVPQSDHFFNVTGFRSLLAAPIASATELYGALEVYAQREHAFDEADAELLEAFAAQAAIALENARLIAELEAANGAIARRAEEERTLREIAARISAMDDPMEILGTILRAARRLLDSHLAAISLSEAVAGRSLFTDPVDAAADFSDPVVAGEMDPAELPGVWGRALLHGRAVATGDYIGDRTFIHDPRTDHSAAAAGIRSTAAAPLSVEGRTLGTIQVASHRPQAYGASDLEVLEALATQTAAAISNALRIAELSASRAELARRAEVERALREIGMRISASHGVDEVVGLAIDEATRLLGGDSARVDVYQPAIGLLRGLYTSDGTQPTLEEWPDTPDERADQGLSGQAYTHGRTVWTGDYLGDDTFPHGSGADVYVRRVGIRSGIAAPLVGEAGPLGALTVLSTRANAFGSEHAPLLEAIAAQVAISLGSARLIEDLDRSRDDLRRQAEREAALREIGARLTAVGNPDELLRRIVAEARRLIGADGARIDLLDETTMRLRWAIADGTTADADARLLREVGLAMGEGVAGRAAAEGRAVWTDDYLADPSVRPGPASGRFVAETGVRSVLSTPLPGLGRPLGTLSVLAVRTAAFGEADADLLDAFAVQASIALTNSRRLAALARATEENARRATRERALREIAARIGELREPGEIVQLTVDEAARLLGADGARVDIVGDEGVALRRQLGEIVSDDQFRLGFEVDDWDDAPGVAGAAIRLGHAFGTGDYLEDRSFARRPEQDEGIRRLGVRSVLAAPIRGLEGPIGALTVLSRRADAFDLDATATLEALAGLAAAALRNAVLIGRVSSSEERYRYLVQASPDTIWRIDREGRFSFFSSTVETLLGYRPDELVGESWERIVDPDSLEEARADWARLAEEREPIRQRLVLRRRDGSTIATEVSAVGILDDGVFGGAHGAIRDVSERERLERELRESDARLRDLMATSPDLVWEADAEGNLVYIEGLSREMLGLPASELVGRHFSATVFPDEASQAASNDLWEASRREPDRIHTARFSLLHRDGYPVPIENVAVPRVVDGAFVGSRGSARDIRERARLEAELRESEERYRDLVQTSPDGVWQADADGVFTFWSDTAAMLTGFPPEAVLGRHWSTVVGGRATEAASDAWRQLADGDDRVVRVRLDLVRRTGEPLPSEIAAVPVTRDGRFAGAHGSIRDLRDQLRLERELRDSEARFRELVQTSPDGVWQTDPAGNLVFWSDAARSLLGWEPEELMARHWSTVVAPEAVEEVRARLRPLADGPPDAVARVRSTVVRRDGTQIPAEISGVPLFRDGRFAGIQGTIRDLREQVRLERELRDQAGALASSAERAHLARELHDSVTQALFSMGLITRSAEVLLDRDPAATRAKLADLRELQRDALAEMRSLIFELRPGSLEREGLTNALRTHVAAVEGRLGLPIVLDVAEVERLPLAAEDALYRIAQEALHNIVKHANATTVRIELGRDGPEVALRIADDGVGFDPLEVADGHLGLAGMRSRAERVGGRLVVRSAPGRGTEIVVTLHAPPTPPAA